LRGARRPWKWRHRAIGERPLIVRDELARIILMHALGQHGPRIIERDSLVARRRRPRIRAATKALRSCRASREPIFGAQAACDGSAAGVMRNWYGHCQATATREHVTLPSARYYDKALAVQKTVASACDGTPDVEPSRQQPVAAIGNIEEHHMIT